MWYTVCLWFRRVHPEPASICLQLGHPERIRLIISFSFSIKTHDRLQLFPPDCLQHFLVCPSGIFFLDQLLPTSASASHLPVNSENTDMFLIWIKDKSWNHGECFWGDGCLGFPAGPVPSTTRPRISGRWWTNGSISHGKDHLCTSRSIPDDRVSGVLFFLRISQTFGLASPEVLPLWG